MRVHVNFRSLVMYPRSFGALQGDPFVIGIAYWPGANVLQWYVCYKFYLKVIACSASLVFVVQISTTMIFLVGRDPTGTGFPGYNPCIGNVSINGTSVNYQQYLVSSYSVLDWVTTYGMDALFVCSSLMAAPLLHVQYRHKTMFTSLPFH